MRRDATRRTRDTCVQVASMAAGTRGRLRGCSAAAAAASASASEHARREFRHATVDAGAGDITRPKPASVADSTAAFAPPHPRKPPRPPSREVRLTSDDGAKRQRTAHAQRTGPHDEPDTRVATVGSGPRCPTSRRRRRRGRDHAPPFSSAVDSAAAFAPTRPLSPPPPPPLMAIHAT